MDTTAQPDPTDPAPADTAPASTDAASTSEAGPTGAAAPPGWHPGGDGNWWFWDGQRWHPAPTAPMRRPTPFAAIAANLAWMPTLALMWPLSIFVPLVPWAIRSGADKGSDTWRHADEALNTQLSGWVGALTGGAATVFVGAASADAHSAAGAMLAVMLGALTLAWVLAHMCATIACAVANSAGRDRRVLFALPLTRGHRDTSRLAAARAELADAEAAAHTTSD